MNNYSFLPTTTSTTGFDFLKSMYGSGSFSSFQRISQESDSSLSHFESLPLELFQDIISRIGPGELEAVSLLNNQWRELIVNNPALKKKADYQKTAIGPREWAEFFKAPAPSDKEIQAAYACLPDDIHEILNAPCPVFSADGELVKKYGGLVKDTHVLVYIPKSVNGTAFTLRSLGGLAEAKLNPGNRKVGGYEFIHSEVHETLDTPVEEAHWVLMPKDVLGEGDKGPNGSRGKDYPTQEKMVEELAERSGEACMVPQTLEAVAVLIAHLLKSDEYIFGRNPWTYTCCEETLTNGRHVVVGGFAPAGGLYVYYCFDYDFCGVVGLRKFFLGSR